jgi:DNA-directed RNA polymerase subunit RPC12/RpoP
MPDTKTFFRHCPACGRRFEIRLESKKLIRSESYVEPAEKTPVDPADLTFRVILDEEVPTVVNVEEFQYTYKCKHCGHEWSEVHEKHDDEPAPKGYTGD